MFARIMVDDDYTVPARMCDEYATSRRIEGALVEGAAFSTGDRNDAYALQRHD
jgi:hypothetical protein